jgi:hypothetical protein
MSSSSTPEVDDDVRRESRSVCHGSAGMRLRRMVRRLPNGVSIDSAASVRRVSIDAAPRVSVHRSSRVRAMRIDGGSGVGAMTLRRVVRVGRRLAD